MPCLPKSWSFTSSCHGFSWKKITLKCLSSSWHHANWLYFKYYAMKVKFGPSELNVSIVVISCMYTLNLTNHIFFSGLNLNEWMNSLFIQGRSVESKLSFPMTPWCTKYMKTHTQCDLKLQLQTDGRTLNNRHLKLSKERWFSSKARCTSFHFWGAETWKAFFPNSVLTLGMFKIKDSCEPVCKLLGVGEIIDS